MSLLRLFGACRQLSTNTRFGPPAKPPLFAEQIGQRKTRVDIVRTILNRLLQHPLGTGPITAYPQVVAKQKADIATQRPARIRGYEECQVTGGDAACSWVTTYSQTGQPAFAKRSSRGAIDASGHVA